MVKARRILQVWSNVEGMVARGFGESSLTLKPSCILPRTFRQGSAPAHCHLLSIPFLLSYSPYHLPASSFSLCFSFLSLSICFTIALAGSVIPIPDLYNTISTDRVSHCLAQDAFDSTPSDRFILVSFFFFLFFLFLHYAIIFRIFRVLLFHLVFGYFKLLNFKQFYVLEFLSLKRTFMKKKREKYLKKLFKQIFYVIEDMKNRYEIDIYNLIILYLLYYCIS